ncbi:hypothetical protein [Tundra vole stool-associated circular virus]|nr:hypothetical protein [Tundra vole stool-associated circular virus]
MHSVQEFLFLFTLHICIFSMKNKKISYLNEFIHSISFCPNI